MSNSSFQSTGTATLSGTTGTNLTLVTPTISVASSTNGDMWYQASATVARLAKGAANTKLFMNAGATAPEWAAGVKIGTFTRDISIDDSDSSYTGVGFKPSCIYIQHAFAGYGHSVGVDDGTNHYCSGVLYDSASFVSGIHCIYNQNSAATSYAGVIKSFDSDGFTITWDKTGLQLGTLTMYYIAFR